MTATSGRRSTTSRWAAFYAVATKGGTVYAIGGWDGLGPGLTTNESYKVSKDFWTGGLAPMPTLRAEAGAVDHAGRIYVVGGAQPGFGASVNANEAFNKAVRAHGGQSGWKKIKFQGRDMTELFIEEYREQAWSDVLPEVLAAMPAV